MDKKNTFSEKKLYTVFQPIVNPLTREIFAYEALTRVKGKKRCPLDLFMHAHEHGYAVELDLFCMSRAFEKLDSIGENQKLFVNIEPITVGHTFSRGRAREAFVKKIAPYKDRLVFELTESMQPRDFEVMKAGITFLQKSGFSFAIDDVAGIGTKLFSLLTLNPQFIKIDISLIKGVAENFLHQELLRKLVKISRMYHATLIAEGLETREDVEFVNHVGIFYHQGFYFAKPNKQLARSF